MSDARRMIRTPIKFLFCVLCFSLLWGWNAAAQSPHDWLERMVDANGKFNYQGTLVHMCDGTMDIVHIVHRVDHGQVTERLTAQASGGRQIIRNADEVMCILPDQKKVMVERRDSGVSPIGSRIANFPSFSNISASLYDVVMLGSDRVADRETVMLAIRPVDSHRYGYRLWLDRRTALPLKFELVDDDGQGLEQGVFTEIEFHESISAKDVEPTIATDEFEWQRSAVVSEKAEGSGNNLSSGTTSDEPVRSGWWVMTPPPGFKLTFAQSQLAEGATAPMEQLVYSDGLATISVFIESEVEASAAVEGMSRMGATNAFTTFRDGYLITAMGGVPLDTARMVALSVTSR
jgi:sigma-E factor negative regulatory protein RseB